MTPYKYLKPEDQRNYVRLWRTARKWTQLQAAGWYGVSDRQWRKWEAGHASIPEPLLKRMLEFDRMTGRIRDLEACLNR